MKYVCTFCWGVFHIILFVLFPFKFEQLVSNLKLNDIDISQQDKLNIYNTLAGILHLGNINFEDGPQTTQNECKIIPTNEQTLIITAKMLHVDVHDLRNVVLTRISMIHNTVISIPLTVDEAKNVHDGTNKKNVCSII